MRRPFVISTGALVLALLPAVLTAQTPAAQQPADQQPAAQTADAQKPAEPPKVPFTTQAGILLVQIKPDQSAVFEEMAKRLKAGLGKSQDPTLQKQAASFDVYRAQEPFGNNALYVVIIDPAVPNAEYELFAMLQKTMTEEELRAPETAEMWKRYADAFAAGLSKLSLTPVAASGGMGHAQHGQPQTQQPQTQQPQTQQPQTQQPQTQQPQTQQPQSQQPQ